MNKRDKIDTVLAFLLLLIAEIVLFLHVLHMDTWMMICAYWLILTVKNAVAVKGEKNGS